MTEIDADLLAQALANPRPPAGHAPAQWHMDCRAVATALRGTNPRFDVERFMEACRTLPHSIIQD